MTNITARVIADTVWPDPNTGTRITTLQLRYPRFIHSEFMTHRAFSRNASSSRAIPVNKLIQDVVDNPVVPLFWGKNQPGMQAGEEHSQEVITGFGSDDYTFGPREEAWLAARDDAVKWAKNFSDAGYHKQIVNRLLEPFAHINVVVTATEWDNFFELRDHPDAEPHIQLLAQRMKEAMAESHFDVSSVHLPYIRTEEHAFAMDQRIRVSAARCARVSYMTHENKKPDWDKDLELAGKLSDVPPHLSPFEHQARWEGFSDGSVAPAKYANFTEWRSQRYCMERGFNF